MIDFPQGQVGRGRRSIRFERRESKGGLHTQLSKFHVVEAASVFFVSQFPGSSGFGTGFPRRASAFQRFQPVKLVCSCVADRPVPSHTNSAVESGRCPEAIRLPFVPAILFRTPDRLSCRRRFRGRRSPRRLAYRSLPGTNFRTSR